MKIVTLLLSYLKFSPENSLIPIGLSHNVCLSTFIPVVFNFGSVVEILLPFFFKHSRAFCAVLWEMARYVAPKTFSVEAVLGLMSVKSAIVALAIEGVGMFLDHVLALVSGFKCL